jgi:hypothetical protein
VTYNPIQASCKDEAEQFATPQNGSSERLSPESLMPATSSLAEMSTSALAEHCIREISHYRNGQPNDEQYGLELFRRAIQQGNQDAWTFLQWCYSEVVHNWLRRHPNREVACQLDREENYIAQTFERFWFTTSNHQKPAFSSLAAALQYLHASLNSAIVDSLRTYSRSREVPLPVPGTPGAVEPFAEDMIDSGELWELLHEMFSDERERRLIYLFFYCGLKPREIVRCCPQEFPDAHEVYRLRRKIYERLLRDADRLRWRLGANEDQFDVNIHQN